MIDKTPDDVTFNVMAQRFYEVAGPSMMMTDKPKIVAGLKGALADDSFQEWLSGYRKSIFDELINDADSLGAYLTGGVRMWLRDKRDDN